MPVNYKSLSFIFVIKRQIPGNLINISNRNTPLIPKPNNNNHIPTITKGAKELEQHSKTREKNHTQSIQHIQGIFLPEVLLGHQGIGTIENLHNKLNGATEQQTHKMFSTPLIFGLNPLQICPEVIENYARFPRKKSPVNPSAESFKKGFTTFCLFSLAQVSFPDRL